MAILAGAGLSVVGLTACGGNSTPHLNATTSPPTTTSAVATARIRQPFDLQLPALDTPESFKVTVVSVQATESLDPKVLHAFSTAYPKPPGNKWIVVRFSVTNTGHAKAYWNPGVTAVIVGPNAYSQTSADSDAMNTYNSYLSNSGTPTSDFDGINPGVTGTTYGIWDVPTRATPDHLRVPEALGTANVTPDTPSILVNLH
ncbi:hypothetical protein AB0M29_31085 [Streptomyces sp. NPDC051976]|uniref:hypothetical protein n=1 Tax=Streptomyces sp. NPDC051976 TaxID=3154947 RepID=UPI00342DFDA3